MVPSSFWKATYVSLVLLLSQLVGGAHGKSLKVRTEQRRLAEYRTPFTISWSIEVGNGATDRQPTEEEYQWVVEATENWFKSIIETNFGSVEGLDLVDVIATQEPDATTWIPGAAKPHFILIDMEAIWEASSESVVPATNDFLVQLNENSNVRDFITGYLLTTGTDSIFHYSQRVSYLTSSFPFGPTMPTTPGLQPIPAPAPIEPTSPQPTPYFPRGYIIPVALRFGLGIGLGATDRQPRDDEYEGFHQVVDQWFLDSLRQAYAAEPNFFVQEVDSYVTSTSWLPSPTQTTPHNIVVDAFVVYMANSIGDVPTIADFFTTVQSEYISLARLIDPYLRGATPTDNIFRWTSNGQFSADQNGIRFSSNSTASPALAPSTRAPSPAPHRSTPAPVAPEMLIGEVSLTSSWTYNISGEFGIADREPTLEDYIGVTDSTHEWITRIMDLYYNVQPPPGSNLPMFVGVNTTFDRGVYDPSNAENAFHTVFMDQTFTFALDPNDETEVMPFIDDLYDVVQLQDLNQYIAFYVHTSEPIETSVFHGVNMASWAYDTDYTYVPRPTRVPAASSSLGENTGIDPALLVNPVSVAVSLLMRFRLADGTVLEEPSYEEWLGLQEATRQFWIDSFTAAYAADPAAKFVLVDHKWELGSQVFDPAAQYPYQGRFVTDILFESDSLVPADSVTMRQKMVDMLAGSNYLPGYVQTLSLPPDNLFRTVLEASWDF